MKNGDEIKAKITEITPKEIKYKKCNGSDGPVITISKNSVFSILYADGSKEIISSKKSSNELGEGKSQLITVLLCFFVGYLGIHRFYLGHTAMGILYLLTFGLCGIGVLIDFILIITGDLKPKNEDYTDKF